MTSIQLPKLFGKQGEEKYFRVSTIWKHITSCHELYVLYEQASVKTGTRYGTRYHWLRSWVRRVDGWSQWLKLSYCGQLSQLDSPAVTSCHPHSAVCQIFSVSLWIWDTPDHSRWFRYDEQIFFLTHQDYCNAPVPGTVLVTLITHQTLVHHPVQWNSLWL